ncbi:hypothetical protein K438DRAFT_864604 [Mycena galopus ATCC 62051]|nr:hypothetical protein K438DRAFT_864604 [Mycena galopus ATCC 62051]
MPPKPGMKLSMPEYSPDTPELEYTLDLGAETSRASTPLPPDDTIGPSLVRTRSWRPEGVEREQKARSTAYDAAGNLKIAVRGRHAAERDCGICEEVAVAPVKTQCCGALFCRQHIDEWIYAPAADGRCPACKAPCVLPPSRPLSPTNAPANAHSDMLTDSLHRRRPRTPPPSPPNEADESADSIPLAPGSEISAGTSRKYTRSGMDALVRLLSGLAALLLLLGALSRRGGGAGEVVAVETSS